MIIMIKRQVETKNWDVTNGSGGSDSEECNLAAMPRHNPNPRITFPTAMTAKSYDRRPILSRFLPRFIHVLLGLSGSRGSAVFPIGLSISARCSPCVVRSTHSCEPPGTANLQPRLIIVKCSYSNSHTVRALVRSITIYRTKCTACIFLRIDTDVCLE